MRNFAAAVLVFLGGFIIMVLEIVGARFLPRYFGSSFHVWVSQIGVVLVALAMGYYLGGALADRWRRLAPLGWLLLPAGLFTGAIPNMAEKLIDLIVMRHPEGQPIPEIWQKLDPVMGSALVFLLPCVVLAMMSPYVIRLATRSLAQVGRASGMIIALSTVGSIAGVFVSGFVLIEHMKVSNIFRVMGGLTVLLGVLCFVLDRWLVARHPQLKLPNDMNRASNTVGVIILGAVALTWPASAQTLFETTSQYHHIYVADEDGIRTLYFDDTTESQMKVDEPLKGHFEYTEFFHMAWLWNSETTNVLMVGLGGSSTQRSFEHYHPETRIQTVEIDPVVGKVAKDYFHYQESDRQKLHLMDGRVFLRRSTEKYDEIIMDAYTESRYGASIPPHLVTREFFEITRSHLTTNGVLAYNIITTLRDWNTDMVGAVYRTLKEVFPQVYWFKAKTSLNVVLVATQSPAKTDLVALRKKANGLLEAKRMTLPGFLERLYSMQPQPPANFQRCPILSDDFAPVEGLMRGGDSGKKK